MTAKIDGTNGLLQQYDYQVLTTGFSYTFAAGTTVLVMNPAGTLATGTITMPAAPADGMTISFSSTQTVTALTVAGNTGQSIVSAATVLPARQATTYVYRLSNTTWYPMSTVATNVPVAPAGGSIITSGTAVASTSGTSIDFTSLPNWIKRVTVMFSGVSSNATSLFLIQIGSGSVTTSGYSSGSIFASTLATSTAGFLVDTSRAAASLISGNVVITLFGSNTYTSTGAVYLPATYVATNAGVSPALSGALDRVRITTVNGTDTFDAGSINILYE